jgi:ribonuclease BN (tRNA processing enzyme)
VLPVVHRLLGSLASQGFGVDDVAVHEARITGTFSLAGCDALPCLTSFAVRHCHGAIGVRLDLTKSGTSIVFSGDTVPCAAVEAAARGSTLLIHEATFADDMAQDAVRKHHSTVSGALEVVRRAQPRMAILTHFSQRYAHASKVASLLDSMEKPAAGHSPSQKAVPTLLAFDGMQIDVQPRDGAQAAAAAMAPVYVLASHQRDN